MIGMGRDGACGAQPGWVGHTAGYAESFPVCEVGTLLTHDGCRTGRHEKAQVRCPCS